MLSEVADLKLKSSKPFKNSANITTETSTRHEITHYNTVLKLDNKELQADIDRCVANILKNPPTKAAPTVFAPSENTTFSIELRAWKADADFVARMAQSGTQVYQHSFKIVGRTTHKFLVPAVVVVPTGGSTSQSDGEKSSMSDSANSEFELEDEAEKKSDQKETEISEPMNNVNLKTHASPNRLKREQCSSSQEIQLPSKKPKPSVNETAQSLKRSQNENSGEHVHDSKKPKLSEHANAVREAHLGKETKAAVAVASEITQNAEEIMRLEDKQQPHDQITDGAAESTTSRTIDTRHSSDESNSLDVEESKPARRSCTIM